MGSTVIKIPSDISIPCLLVDFDCFSYELNLVFEPLYSIHGSMIAIEVLTCLQPLHGAPTLSKVDFFYALNNNLANKVLRWQLNCLKTIYPWISSRNLLVSLNINRVMASAFIELVAYADILSPFLRLEINEYFFNSSVEPENDVLFLALSSICPLWLDDFGTGTANLQALMTLNIEVIKLDAFIYKIFDKTIGGYVFIDALCQIASEAGVLLAIEGVETSEQLSKIKGFGVWGVQGFFWEKIQAEKSCSSFIHSI